MYDNANIFARILRKEIPCNPLLETPHTLAFHDVAPKAPVHILLIPKGPYEDAQAFYQKATPEEILDFSKAIAAIASMFTHDGFRLVSNAGKDAGQEVPHFHLHFLAGKSLGNPFL